jgi:uncharacterized protein (TIRG00374 family)
VVLGLGLFAGLIYLSGPGLVFRELVAVGWLGFLMVVGNVVLSFFVWSLSWFVLLHAAGVQVRWQHVLSPMLAASSVTYLTPSAYLGGEPVRVYWLAKSTGAPLPTITATVMVERLLAGISLLAFASIGGFFALFSPTISLADKGAVALGLGLMAVFLSLGVFSFARNRQWLSRFLRALSRIFRWRGILARLAQSASDMENQIYRVFADRLGHAALALLLQLVMVFLTYIRPQLFFYFTKQALFTFAQLSLFFTLNVFVNSFLWITPGGLGLTDGGRAGIFQLLGIPISSAIAYNVLFRFVELIQVGWGLFLLFRQGLLRWAQGRLEVKIEGKPKS